MKITVVGTGYVGLSIAVLLARRHQVVALDISKEKVAQLIDANRQLKTQILQGFSQSTLSTFMQR